MTRKPARPKPHGPSLIERGGGKTPLKRYMGDRPITTVAKAVARVFSKPATQSKGRRK